MNQNQIFTSIQARLSLRPPQSDSLAKLATILENVPSIRNREQRSPEELTAIILALQNDCPELANFERNFPSFCFALATGVGKTRLMGAFITYLYLTYQYQHFFILAPNLTIYNKLSSDFAQNNPKYVLKGISEFTHNNSPRIITGDDYNQYQSDDLLTGIEINIFNISKINTEVRGGKSPRIKRISECLGQNYFNYLSSLPDLILIMDESHRYRGSAGVRALNELNPLFALELTATPFTEARSGPIAFKNIIFNYPLAHALADGFVKEPAIVTQQNFDPQLYTPEQIERIKLNDGIHIHETIKANLAVYARQYNQLIIKPFMLVIARDTTHAGQLMQFISTELENGSYSDKVIQVDSETTSGTEGDTIVQKLLAVESATEPTEIVIHVNMLKEGWDVTNLYTIVPLRPAHARTLIEQSIGRGLRLPYGKKTGVETVDRLNIIAHDNFQAILDEAGRTHSPITLKTTFIDSEHHSAAKMITSRQTYYQKLDISDPAEKNTATAQPVSITQLTVNIIEELSRDPKLLPTRSALRKNNIQDKIINLIDQRLTPCQKNDLADNAKLNQIVSDTINTIINDTLDIPRILVKPKGTTSTAYHPFSLDCSKLNYSLQDKRLISHGLATKVEISYGQNTTIYQARLEDYILQELREFNDLAYHDHAEFINQLITQALAHIQSYSDDPTELHKLIRDNRKAIAANIYAQLRSHYYEISGELEIKVLQGFIPLKSNTILATDDKVKSLDWLPDNKRNIAQYLYGHFTRCAYEYQKFHSNPERILAQILERDARIWLRPLMGQLSIYYLLNSRQHEYVPDFIAATDKLNLIIEIKAAHNLNDPDVLAKQQAALAWCKYASDYSCANGGNPWQYLLIPHDAVALNYTLEYLIKKFFLTPAHPHK